MPEFRIIINLQISQRLKDYIIATYGANISKIKSTGNAVIIRATAPDEQTLNAALVDIRSRLVEIESL